MRGFANDEIAHCHPLVGWMELQHLCKLLILDGMLGRRLIFHSLLTLASPSLSPWMFPTSSLPYVCSSPSKRCDTVAHNPYSSQSVSTMFLTFGPSLSLHGLSLFGRKYSS